MRKINRIDVFRLVLVLALVAGIGFAMGSIGRFVPTHKIVEPVYCGSCHPEQVEELGETTHLADFAERIERNIENTNPTVAAEIPAARYISGGCTMCHNYWDNFKWFGLKNVNLSVVEGDVPSLGMIQTEGDPKDIYGNAVSPYGLGSTKSYMLNVTGRNYKSGLYPPAGSGGAGTVSWNQIALPWAAGLDVYQYTNTTSGDTYYRLDYVWSLLSSVSPGPVGFNVLNVTDPGTSIQSCGTAEKGMCHAAVDSVALSFMGQKREFPEFDITSGVINGNVATNGSNGTYSAANVNFKTLTGSGTFFQHEMAFTTAQFAAKPVKLCGACHVFKLPPMRWGGEPWAVKDVWDFSQTGGATNSDPFGFKPTYNDLTGQAELDAHVNARVGSTTFVNEKEFKVMFRTPDWAHANVPCIRCHVHAGIQGKLVSNNEAEIVPMGTATPAPIPPSPGSASPIAPEYSSPDYPIGE